MSDDNNEEGLPGLPDEEMGPGERAPSPSLAQAAAQIGQVPDADEDESEQKRDAKMRIRSFPMIMTESVNTNLEILKTAIEEILLQGNTGLIFEELYRIAYSMVLHKHAELLYNCLAEVIKNHYILNVRPTLLENKHNNFLQVISQAWNDHMRSMVWVRDILMYMDRVYTTQSGKDNVVNLGFKTFKREIILHKEICSHLKLCLIDIINRDRDGEFIDRLTLKNTCQMLTQVGIDDRSVYESIFEKPFLKQSEIFYRMESEKILQVQTLPEYINLVECRLNEETERAQQIYSDASTERRISEIVENELIKRNSRMIVEDVESEGVLYMLEHEKIDELGAVYRLLSRVNHGLELLAERVSRFIRDEGKGIVIDKNPISFVQRLLDLKDKMENINQTAFSQDRIFLQQISADIQYTLNINPKSPEYLSLFIDDKIKKEVRGISAEDIEKVLDKTMTLLNLLFEKDLFEQYYKKHLASRLLAILNKSVTSLDNSRKFEGDLFIISSGILKLKKEIGKQLSTKLEGMVKDLSLSNSTNEEFKNYVAKSAIDLKGIDLTVCVLTTVFWPIELSNIPGIVSKIPISAFDEFKKFYLKKHNGRKLVLNHQLGSADLDAVFHGSKRSSLDEQNQNQSEINRTIYRKFTIQASTYQMCILLLFNDKSELTFEEILTETQIPQEDLKFALCSLAMGKSSQRILEKSPKSIKSKIINPTDIFRVNDSFNSKTQRVKMITSKIKILEESENERAETLTRIVKMRKLEIEGTIIRILKVRRTLHHDALFEEVAKQLKPRFMPTDAAITKLLEELSAQNYVRLSIEEAEDKTTRKLYTYVI